MLYPGRTPRWRIFFFGVRGLPVGLWRRVRSASKSLVSTFYDIVAVKVASVLGIHLSKFHFDPNRVQEYLPIGKCIYCGKSGPDIAPPPEKTKTYIRTHSHMRASSH